MSVEFFVGAPPEEGTEATCVGETSLPLEPGSCELLSCLWEGGLPGEAPVVYVVVDRAGSERECWDENNWTVFTPSCEEAPG